MYLPAFSWVWGWFVGCTYLLDNAVVFSLLFWLILLRLVVSVLLFCYLQCWCLVYGVNSNDRTYM